MKLSKKVEKWGRELLAGVIRLSQRIFSPKESFSAKEFNLNQIRRILAIMYLNIGDMVLLLPMIEALKKSIPEVSISILGTYYNKEIIVGNPDIDEIFTLFSKRPSLLAYLRFPFLIRELKKRKFDLVVSPLSGAFTAGFIAYLTGAPYRLGWISSYSELFFNLLASPKPEKHRVEFYLDLIRSLGLPVDSSLYSFPIFIPKEDKQMVKEFLFSHRIEEGELIVGIHPGGEGLNKRWPPDRFARLADELILKHGARVIVTWGPGEEDLVRQMVNLMKERPLVSFKTNIKQLAFLIKEMTLFISNSTGPLHIAVAMDTPVIGLYRSEEDSVKFGIPPRKRLYRLVVAKGGGISSIGVEEVFSKASELLLALRPGGRLER